MPPKGSKKKAVAKPVKDEVENVQESEDEQPEVAEKETGRGKRSRSLSNDSQESNASGEPAKTTKKAKQAAKKQDIEEEAEAEEDDEEEDDEEEDDDKAEEEPAPAPAVAEPTAVAQPASEPTVAAEPEKPLHDTEQAKYFSQQLAMLFPGTSSEGGRVVTMEVPKDRCGTVIGPRGTTISMIQARTGAKVDLDQNVPEGMPRIIKCAGEPSSVQAAADLVRAILRDGPQAAHPLAMAGGERCTEVVQCAKEFVGRVIGTSGNNIKDIQGRSGAAVQVHQQGLTDDQPRRVEVTGTTASVKEAVELINYVIANGPHLPPLQPGQPGYIEPVAPSGMPMGMAGPGAPGVGRPGGVFEAASNGQIPGVVPAQATGGGIALIVDCEKQYCGRVIGRGGETIKGIERQSGARVQVDQNVPVGHPCKVTLSGPEPNVTTALNMVQDIMMNGAGGGPGGPSGNMFGGPPPMQMGGGYGQPPMGGHGGYGPPMGGPYGYGGPGGPPGPGGYGQPPMGYGQAPQQHQQHGGPGGYGQPRQVHGQQHQQQPGGYGQPQQHGQQQHGSHNQQQQAPYGAAAPPPARGAGGLPVGWEEHKDPSTGNSYFHNQSTGVTQWNRP